jgi:hypothetical protein
MHGTENVKLLKFLSFHRTMRAISYAPSSKSQIMAEFKGHSKIVGSSVWDWPHVPLPALIIWSWLLNFWETYKVLFGTDCSILYYNLISFAV